MNHSYVILICVVIIIVFLVVAMHAYLKSDIQNGAINTNKLLSKYCYNGPLLKTSDFDWTKEFKQNWEIIRDEYIDYQNKYVLPNYKDISIHSGNTEGWKSIFLKIFDVDTEVSNLFPTTKKMINSIPCTSAYFSILEPGVKLKPHKGIYKGVLRYHLGLIIPEDWKNVFINIDGYVTHWKNGEDIMFDDMYEHYVENNTTERRVILFLDIKRDFNNVYLNYLNNMALKLIKSNEHLVESLKKADTLSKTLKENATKPLKQNVVDVSKSSELSNTSTESHDLNKSLIISTSETDTIQGNVESPKQFDLPEICNIPTEEYKTVLIKKDPIDFRNLIKKEAKSILKKSKTPKVVDATQSHNLEKVADNFLVML